MNKVELIQAYEEINQWFESLQKVDEERWFAPIDEGKWSMAAVISHLLFWDRYSLEERFPFMKKGAVLPSFPDFETVNNKARVYAEEGVSKLDLLEELKQTREELLSVLHAYSEEDLDTKFLIGEHELTIREYFVDFIQHDNHHKRQIELLIL